MSWYILIDREFCTVYVDAVHFFQILICYLFSAYFYMMSLSDFRPIFLDELKLNQSVAETARKIIQAFGNDVVNERTVGLRNFVPKILASKLSSEVVDLQ